MLKHIGLILSCSLVSAILAIAIYHKVIGPPKIVVQEGSQPARFATHSDALFPNAKQRWWHVSAPTDFIDAAQQSREAVVFIRSIRGGSTAVFSDEYSSSTGSGVIVSPDGFIVTNHHVIEQASRVEVTLNDNREFDAKILGSDPTSDLALIQISTGALPYVAFGNSDSLQVGEWVLAVGNPFRLQSSVTAGIVSAKARRINILESMTGIESFIQTDAAVNPGNSGGALINTRGELVGINTAIMTYTGGYEGFSFAIPSNLTQKVIYDLKEYGAVQRGWLGITIIDVDDDRAKELDLDFVKGVYIAVVNDDGAAEEAGLRNGDIILSVNSTETHSTPQFMEQVARYRPGDRIKIHYVRNGKSYFTHVILRNHLNTTDFVAIRKDKTLTDLGFELRDLDSQERKRMNSRGVMVVSIYRGSVVDKTNMEPGYVITKVNGKKVVSVEEVVRAIADISGTVTLEGFYENYPGVFPYQFKK